MQQSAVKREELDEYRAWRTAELFSHRRQFGNSLQERKKSRDVAATQIPPLTGAWLLWQYSGYSTLPCQALHRMAAQRCESRIRTALEAAVSDDLDRRALNSSAFQALFMSENPVQPHSAGRQ
jgi:hypothetical protein